MRRPAAGIISEGRAPRRREGERCGRPWHSLPRGSGPRVRSPGCRSRSGSHGASFTRPARRSRIRAERCSYPRRPAGSGGYLRADHPVMGAATRLARPALRSANWSPHPHGWRIALREVGGVDVFPATMRRRFAAGQGVSWPGRVRGGNRPGRRRLGGGAGRWRRWSRR